MFVSGCAGFWPGFASSCCQSCRFRSCVFGVSLGEAWRILLAVTDGMQLLPAHVQKYRTKHIVDDVVPYHVAPSFASACVCCSVHGGLGFGLIWPCVADFVFIASSLGFHLQCKVRPCQPVSDLYRSRSSMFMSRSGSHIRFVCLVFFWLVSG